MSGNFGVIYIEAAGLQMLYPCAGLNSGHKSRCEIIYKDDCKSRWDNVDMAAGWV